VIIWTGNSGQNQYSLYNGLDAPLKAGLVNWVPETKSQDMGFYGFNPDLQHYFNDVRGKPHGLFQGSTQLSVRRPVSSYIFRCVKGPVGHPL